MSTSVAIFKRVLQRLLHNPIALVIALGVCIVPCLYAWLNIASNWDPYENTSTIPVAVVSQDKPVELEDMGSICVGDMMLEELAEKLSQGEQLSAADVWERLAATVACKAAVKANTPVAEEGLLALAEKVMSGEIARCPHGRPVMTVFTRAELDKRFGRIV